MNNFLFSPSFRKTLQAALLLTILFFSLGPAGTFTVYAAPPSNDNFANGTVITTIPYTNTVVTTEATEQASEPPVPTACDGRLLDLGVKTVWYRYTPTVTGPVYADSFGTDYDTYIAVWRGSSLGTLTFVTCDDDNEAGGYESQVGWTATAGVTYHIQVAGYDGTVGIPNQGNSGGTLPFHMTSFRDVPGDYWAWRYVEGLFDAGVTAGCNTNPALYCPLGGITRDQMAVFLLKAIHGANYTPPPATGDFLDVPTNYWAAAWIEQLYAEGITAGCTVNPNNFCPTTPVARDQMAVFLLKAKYGAAHTPPAQTGVFADIPMGYWAGSWIEQLAAEGITGGCSVIPSNYCPLSVVSRDQMAVFLVKTFNLPLLP